MNNKIVKLKIKHFRNLISGTYCLDKIRRWSLEIKKLEKELCYD